MSIATSVRSAFSSFAALAVLAVFAAGCGSYTSTSSINSQAKTGAAFVIGTDAPMASVVSFTVNIGISATDANGNTVQLTTGTPTVDFARFNGLQTLIDKRRGSRKLQ